MLYEFSCSLSTDDVLLVHCRPLVATESSTTAFPDDEHFLLNLLSAALKEEDMLRIMREVLLAISGMQAARHPITIQLSQEQLLSLGLMHLRGGDSSQSSLMSS